MSASLRTLRKSKSHTPGALPQSIQNPSIASKTVTVTLSLTKISRFFPLRQHRQTAVLGRCVHSIKCTI